MSNAEESRSSASQSGEEAASEACRSPLAPARCPLCGAAAVSAEWNLSDPKSREALVDLHCSACGGRNRIAFSSRAAACYAFERFASVARAFAEEIEPIAARVRQHVKAMPAAAFATHPRWAEARWSATTYKWHPTSEAPPLMGLVFENVEAGIEIFRDAEREMNHEDRFEEIRVSIIEGAVPGRERRPGYSVHICADPDALAAHATLEDFVVDPRIVPTLGQWNRHYPVPGASPLLLRFKEEVARHNEFMLAPAVPGADGRLYLDSTLGIIKSVIFFRELSEITTPDDPDAAALFLPQLITPPY